MFVGKVPHNRWPRPKALVLNLIVNQRAKKVVSDSLGPVDFDIGLVIFVLNAPINVNPVGGGGGVCGQGAGMPETISLLGF